MADYCTILLSQTTKSDVLAACIQAAAAVHAGEAQAAAVRQAGWVSFAAGLFALLAGALAYRASKSQIREVENQRLAKEAAYAAQICAISMRARDELIDVFLAFKGIDDGSSTQNLNGVYFTSIQLLRDELKPVNWEQHALLGSEHLDQLIIVYECVQSLLVEVERFSSIRLPHLDVYRGVAVSKNAKVQCETLMAALAHKAPPAMRSGLEPIKLLSA